MKTQSDISSTVYIVRHGRTDLNQARVLQGRSDWPLNETGIRQAKEAADRLQGIQFDHVFTSPLMRAVQTARMISPDTPMITDNRLMEMDYGPYEGVYLNCLPPEIQTFFSDFNRYPAPEGMEQLADVVKRAGEFLETIRPLCGNILVSTHAIAMKGLLTYLTLDTNDSYWSRHIGNCAIYVTENRNGVFDSAREFNPKG